MDTDGTYLFASDPSEGYVYTTPPSPVYLNTKNATALWIWFQGSASGLTVGAPCATNLGTITVSTGDFLRAYQCTQSSLTQTVEIVYGSAIVGEVMLFEYAPAAAAVVCVFYPCD